MSGTYRKITAAARRQSTVLLNACRFWYINLLGSVSSAAITYIPVKDDLNEFCTQVRKAGCDNYTACSFDSLCKYLLRWTRTVRKEWVNEIMHRYTCWMCCYVCFVEEGVEGALGKRTKKENSVGNIVLYIVWEVEIDWKDRNTEKNA